MKIQKEKTLLKKIDFKKNSEGKKNVDSRIYNLRHELARQIWAGRNGKININEALENTRDLVALCPVEKTDAADQLQHAVLNQITKKYAKILMRQRGINADTVRVPAINTRQYLGTVALPAGFIG